MVKATIAKVLQYNKLAKSLLWSKWCYKCKKTNHQARNCSHGQPQELLVDQDDNAPSSAYQPLLHHPMLTVSLEEWGRTAYRPVRYVNLIDSPVFGKQGNSSPPTGNVFKRARSQSPKTYRNFPDPNEGQLPHRYRRPAPSDWQKNHDHKQARTLSPTQITHETEINDDTSNLEAKEDIATELVQHAQLETFDQEQTWEALQNLLKDAPKDIIWQLAHTARLRRTITDNWVYMSAQKSMTIRFYTHSAKKQAEGVALVDSSTTKNFLNLNYAQWLGLPIRCLEKPRQLFNVDGTKNKVGALQFYMDVSLQTGSQHTNHHFFLSDLEDNKAIFGYPWFASAQPKINWARGWINSLQLPIILRSPNAQKAQFIARNSRTAIKQTTEGTTIRRLKVLPTAQEAIQQIITKGKLQVFVRSLQLKQAKQDIPPEELKTIPLEYHCHLKVFSEKAAAHLLPDHLWNHAIELKPDAPTSIWGRIYPLTQLENKALKRHVDEQLAKRYICPSKSPYMAPFFFIKKKSGELRPIYNYWELTKWTVRNHYPLPLISELIYRLQGCDQFTKFNIHNGYHNLKIKPEDIWKGAFLTNRGLYEPIVMPFGMCNTPASFQAMTNQIFRDFINEGWLTVYIDNIIVHMQVGESLESHCKKVYKVLNWLEENDLYLQPSKCTFKQKETDFLGIVISHKTVSMDIKKLANVADWQPPKDIWGVRRFLGFTGFYQHFVAGYSEIVRPLLQLMKKAATWH